METDQKVTGLQLMKELQERAHALGGPSIDYFNLMDQLEEEGTDTMSPVLSIVAGIEGRCEDAMDADDDFDDEEEEKGGAGRRCRHK